MNISRLPTALIIDDEPNLRQVLAMEFEMIGFQTFLAGNGNEGMEVIKNRNVDLLMTDIRMPGGDGIDLLRALGNLNLSKKPFTILMTGDLDFRAEEAKRLGADAVIAKPFDWEVLSQLLQEKFKLS